MKNKVPRWLELQYEIDFNYFLLGQMYREEISRSVLEKMIDQATGFQNKKIKDAKKIMRKIRKLQVEFDKIFEGS